MGSYQADVSAVIEKVQHLAAMLYEATIA